MRIQILLSSGAHLSRYLVQIAMHHYFQTQTHFIKTPWVKNVPLGVFLYFMQKAQEKYGDIPRGKVGINVIRPRLLGEKRMVLLTRSFALTGRR